MIILLLFWFLLIVATVFSLVSVVYDIKSLWQWRDSYHQRIFQKKADFQKTRNLDITVISITKIPSLSGLSSFYKKQNIFIFAQKLPSDFRVIQAAQNPLTYKVID